MRSDTHVAALRAAARVAFSVAFLGGCSAAGSALAGADDGSTNDDTTGSSEDAVRSKHAKSAKDASAAKKPCDDAEDASRPSCDSVLASAFADAGSWTSGSNAVSAEAKSCCIEALAKEVADGESFQRSAYHWQCCNATNGGEDVDGGVGWACTPWGPPVPPPMTRKTRTRHDTPAALQLGLEVA